MRKALYIIVTMTVMIIMSRFAVRIVDATVQIDGNVFMLVLFLAAVNTLTVVISYRLYMSRRI